MTATTQADRAYSLLTADIIACRLAPGARLAINVITEQMGVSLGAIREALSRLSADGLVIAEAQKGYTVAPVSRADVLDLTQTRISIEKLCLQDSLAHGDVEWESRTVAAQHRLSRLPSRDPSQPKLLNPAWSAAHAEFHEALVGACRSPWLLRIRAMLYARSERYRHVSVPLEVTKRDVSSEHDQILDAVLKRDAERAGELMAEHFSRTLSILLDGLPEPEGAVQQAFRTSSGGPPSVDRRPLSTRSKAARSIAG